MGHLKLNIEDTDLEDGDELDKSQEGGHLRPPFRYIIEPINQSSTRAVETVIE